MEVQELYADVKCHNVPHKKVFNNLIPYKEVVVVVVKYHNREGEEPLVKLFTGRSYRFGLK